MRLVWLLEIIGAPVWIGVTWMDHFTNHSNSLALCVGFSALVLLGLYALTVIRRFPPPSYPVLTSMILSGVLLASMMLHIIWRYSGSPNIWMNFAIPLALCAAYQDSRVLAGTGAVAMVAVAAYAIILHQGWSTAVAEAAGILLWTGALSTALYLIVHLRAARETAQAQIRRDGLTGLGNEIALREDYRKRPGYLTVADIRAFKLFNDRYGHTAGDAVLRHVAEHLAAIAQDAYRLRGPIFALLTNQPAIIPPVPPLRLDAHVMPSIEIQYGACEPEPEIERALRIASTRMREAPRAEESR